MRIGLFADSHDHKENLRRTVEYFNRAACELVLFAGDLVSTFAVPPLRKLACPVVACFGDNEGNKIGLRAGFTLVGRIDEPPIRLTLADGTRLVLCHMQRQLRGLPDDWEIAVFGHTHKPRVRRDASGRLWINPGEVSGWTFDNPTVAILETTTKDVSLVSLRTGEVVPLPVEQPRPAAQRPTQAVAGPPEAISRRSKTS
jgi:putative phosphoesterase